MKRIQLVTAIIVSFILVMLSGCGDKADINAPKVVKGEINLSGRNFEQQGPASLDGEWEFYPCSGTSPDMRECLPKNGQKDYFPLPSIWTGTTTAGVHLKPEGRGIYRLNVRLDDDENPKCLYLSGLLSTCRVSVNGRVIAWSGVVGTDAESEKPQKHLLDPCFFPDHGANEIILEVSNFHNAQGGINAGVTIGTHEQIQSMVSARRVTGAVVGGALLIMGIFHLVIFVMRKANKENLYFGLFCLVWCVGTVFNPPSAYLAAQILNIDWGWYINICLLPLGLAVPLLVLFYHAVFPKKIGKTVNLIYAVFGVSFCIYILATPPNAYSKIAFYYFLISRTAYIYLFGAFAVDLINKRKWAVYLAPGYLALGFSEFDEILFDLNLIHSTEFTHIGAFIFILSYSILMSVRFAETMTHIDDISEKLESQKEAERKNSLMWTRLSKLLDSIGEAVVAVNDGYEINYCNRAFTTMTGYQFKDIEKQKLTYFMREPGQEKDGAAKDMLPKLPSSPASSTKQDECQLLTADRDVLDISVVVTQLDFADKVYSVVIQIERKTHGQTRYGSSNHALRP